MPNRLADETSPYLLQHKDNPVDWWPWGEAAFAEATHRGVPVFLSVGYSACHWCHVMEHESFESEAIAKLMNEHFVCIKVDREERPDVDAIYMTATQLMTGSGGWPMSVFLTPDTRQPFFAGTYWPPTAKFGRPGFREILLHIHDAWETRRDEVMQAAESSTAAIARLADPTAGRDAAAVTADLIPRAAQAILPTADREQGGFGAAPKFPHAMDIRVLLRAAAIDATDAPDLATTANDALAIATLTLSKMADGGLYDQLGGGFHRYSTDARWLAPHFEKMLYDQALLLPAYLEAWQLLPTDDARRTRYEQTIHETLDYLHREMIVTDGDGLQAYAATQDADTEGEEGKFFVWSLAEADAVLRPKLGDRTELFTAFYDITGPGNWEGHSILNRPQDAATFAAAQGVPLEELHDTLAAGRVALAAARESRVRPGRDDKVLASWNGMMIAAAARCGAAVGRFDAVETAAAAADLVLAKLRRPNGRLHHAYKDGRARFDGNLDDYAALIDGLCELYQATFDGRRLDAATELAEVMHAQFADPDGGASFFTPVDGEDLIVRQKDVQDSAVPAASALAATALLKLGLLTGQTVYLDRGEVELRAMSGLLSEHPRACGQALIAVALLTGPPQELIVAGDPDATLADAIRRRFLPSSVLLGPSEHPGAAAPLLAGKTADKPTLYRCERGVCRQPVVGLQSALDAVESM